MNDLLKRLEAVEKGQPTSVDAFKKEIVQYALRRYHDFDKYQALDKAERLKIIAQEQRDAKATY